MLILDAFYRVLAGIRLLIGWIILYSKIKVCYKWILVQIWEGAFGSTYFEDNHSGINGKWYKNSWKEFDQLKDIDQKFYCSYYYDVSVNKYGVKCWTSLRFWENKGWINEIDPYGFLNGILDTGLVEDRKMMKDKLIDRKEL